MLLTNSPNYSYDAAIFTCTLNHTISGLEKSIATLDLTRCFFVLVWRRREFTTYDFK